MCVYVFAVFFMKRQKGAYTVLISTFYPPTDSSLYSVPVWVLHFLPTDNDHLTIIFSKIIINTPNKETVSHFNSMNDCKE